MGWIEGRVGKGEVVSEDNAIIWLFWFPKLVLGGEMLLLNIAIRSFACSGLFHEYMITFLAMGVCDPTKPLIIDLNG